MSKVKKVMLVGWDGAVGQRVIELAQQGHLPAVKSLLDQGIYASHCLAPHPTMTPPNWTTIATGAWQGTHGITGFNLHNPGDPLLEVHQAFDARDVQAEFIWDALARAGKRSIVLNWPTAYPAEPQDGVCIAGHGIGPNDWRCGVPEHIRDHEADIADEQLFTTELYREATPIELTPAQGWENAPAAKSLREAELVFRYRNAHRQIKTALTWHMLVVDSSGDGYQQVILSESRDAGQAFARLAPGDWSPKLTRQFETTDGPITAEYRVKLEAMEPDLSDLRLYVTPLCNPDGWSYPPGTMGQVRAEDGLPLPEAGFSAATLGWISPETYLEMADMLHEWQVATTQHLLENHAWDLFLVHYHLADITYHLYGRLMEPAFNDEDPEYYQSIERQAYQSLDRALARTLELAGEDTLVVLVGDHGCKPTTGRFSPAKLLVEAGLTVFKDAQPDEPIRSRRGLTAEAEADPTTMPVRGVLDRTMAEVIEQGSGEIDWSRTKAVMQRSSYVYVNLKGRDPHGIVEPGEEYEQVCQQIIRLLYDYTDPVSGEKPVLFALQKKDARMLGLWGERIGDVVFGLNGSVGRQHGAIAPTASYGRLSLKTAFVMAGPGVKKGQAMTRNMWLVDVVPTICHLAEWPVPQQCEGAVLYQALVNPDAKSNELERLRKQLRRALGAQIM